MADGVVEGLLQRVPPGAARLAERRHQLPLAAGQVIAAVGDAAEDVRHVVVAEGVHVRLRLVADHGVEVAEGPTENGHALRLAALVEGAVGDGGGAIAVAAGAGGRRLEHVCVGLSHAHHDHSRLVDVWIGVHHTPVDAGVLQPGVLDLQHPPFAGWEGEMAVRVLIANYWLVLAGIVDEKKQAPNTYHCHG